jgi:hypothetical protein
VESNVDQVVAVKTEDFAMRTLSSASVPQDGSETSALTDASLEDSVKTVKKFVNVSTERVAIILPVRKKMFHFPKCSHEISNFTNTDWRQNAI